jgi:hypothetical protein
MSKGSTPRPYSVSQDQFANNFDSIFGKKKPKEQYVPPPLPVVEKKSNIEWVNSKVDTEQQDK